MDERQIAIKRQARRTIGVVASWFGLLFLVVSLSSHRYGWLLLGSTVITGIAVISSLFSRYLIRAAIAQSALALTTALCAVLFTFDSEVLAIGPSSAAGLLGSLLVVFGAFARVNAEPGRTCEDRIVAIEEWADGRWC